MQPSPGYRSSAAPRLRFEGTRAVSRRAGVAAVLGINLAVVVIGLGCALLRPVVPASALGAFAVVAFLGASAVFYAVVLRTRVVPLEVDGDRLFVDDGRGGSFPVLGVRLGPWRAATGVVCGSALLFSDGPRAYRIGGLDHRSSVPRHLEGPVVDDVEVSLPQERFAELLARVGAAPRVGDGERSPSVRVRLAPNPSAPGVAVGNMLPWIGTIALVVVMGVAFSAIGLYEWQYGQYLGLSLTVIVIIGGLVLTIVRSRRRGTGLELELDDGALYVLDTRRGGVVASAPYGALGRARGVWNLRVRGFVGDYPAVVLTVPGYGEVSVCVQDPRFLWYGGAPPVAAPRFLVGAPDWTALVERLGLAPRPQA
jgi:hypothetical protein